MSSFADQGGQLRGSLIEAGLPAAAATIIANILGNSVQTLRHSGEVIHDQTPAGLRQVTPDDRTHRLTNVDFRAGDPDYRRPRSRDSEDLEKPTPQNTVLASTSPQQDKALFRIKSGAYTEVMPAGDAATVNVKMGGGGNCVFRDAQANTLLGKRLRAECDAGDMSRVRFFIEERADEVVFKLSLQGMSAKPIPVVTDITYEPGAGFRISYANIYAWAGPDGGSTLIPVVRQPFVERGYLGGGGIVLERKMTDQLFVAAAAPNIIPVTDCPQ